MSLAYLPWQRPTEYDGRPCLRDGDTELTYAEFGARVEAAAEQFAEYGVVPGTVVAVMLPNRVELLVAIVAAWRLGAAATPINPVTSFYNQETPPTTPESRARSTPASKLGLNVGSYRASPSADGSDTWSSRERIKAVTSVDISPNGRFLAVGEVSGILP